MSLFQAVIYSPAFCAAMTVAGTIGVLGGRICGEVTGRVGYYEFADTTTFAAYGAESRAHQQI